jgi:hypothetical protein
MDGWMDGRKDGRIILIQVPKSNVNHNRQAYINEVILVHQNKTENSVSLLILYTDSDV